MDKDILRKRYKEIRKAIINKEEKSKIIANQIINSDVYLNSKVIALYSNLPQEVNTNELIKKSLEDKKVVVLPRVIDKYNMQFYQIESIDELNCGNFNIMEPSNNKLINKEYIDLMILPGICFDKEFNRIGFGKGYYDRYLLSDSNIYKLGICFDEQLLIDNIIDINEYDVKLDLLITNRRVILNKSTKKYQK